MNSEVSGYYYRGGAIAESSVPSATKRRDPRRDGVIISYVTPGPHLGTVRALEVAEPIELRDVETALIRQTRHIVFHSSKPFSDTPHRGVEQNLREGETTP